MSTNDTGHQISWVQAPHEIWVLEMLSPLVQTPDGLQVVQIIMDMRQRVGGWSRAVEHVISTLINNEVYLICAATCHMVHACIAHKSKSHLSCISLPHVQDDLSGNWGPCGVCTHELHYSSFLIP